MIVAIPEKKYISEVETETLYTTEEYLLLEEKSEIKHEYHKGRIMDMSGGTPNHNEIAGNFYVYLKLALRGKNYKIFINDVRLWIPAHNLYTYPDIMLIEGQPSLQENRTDTVLNPSLIVEVLSKSTKNYDQEDKFNFYRSLDTFKEYILIEQDRYYVQHFIKTGQGEWLMREYTSNNDNIKLGIVEVQIPLNDIYAEIVFE